MYNKQNTLTAYNYKDNSFYLNIKTWLDNNGQTLTGATLTLSVTNSFTAGGSLFSVTQSTHESVINGISIMTIPSATIANLAAGAYYYELNFTNASAETYTITQSDFLVGQSIKQS